MELLQLLPESTLKDVNIGQKGRASIITCVFGGILQSEVCNTINPNAENYPQKADFRNFSRKYCFFENTECFWKVLTFIWEFLH